MTAGTLETIVLPRDSSQCGGHSVDEPPVTGTRCNVAPLQHKSVMRGGTPLASLSSCSLSITPPVFSSRCGFASPQNLRFSSNPKKEFPKAGCRAGMYFNLFCSHRRFWGHGGCWGTFSSASAKLCLFRCVCQTKAEQTRAGEKGCTRRTLVLHRHAKLPSTAGGSSQQMNRSTQQLPQLHPPLAPTESSPRHGGYGGGVGCKSQRCQRGRWGCRWAAPCQMCGGDGMANLVCRVKGPSPPQLSAPWSRGLTPGCRQGSLLLAVVARSHPAPGDLQP